MPEQDTRTVDEVGARANRLRLVQVDLADEDASVRADYLTAEMERALESVPLNRRPAFLAQLSIRFPAVGMAGRDQTMAGVPLGDSPELRDPDFLIDRLLEIVPTLSTAEQDRLVDRLVDRDFVPAPAATETVAGASGHGGDAQARDEMTTILTEFVHNLDTLVGNALRQIAPDLGEGLPERKRGELENAVSRFLASGEESARAQAQHRLLDLRGRIAALMAAIPQTGRLFGQRHVAEFSPEEIEAVVRLKGKPFVVSWEVAFWRRYCAMASRDLTEDKIDRDIRKCVAGCVEKLLQGVGVEEGGR